LAFQGLEKSESGRLKCRSKVIEDDIFAEKSIPHPSDRAFKLFEGTYICPDDDQQYVSLYRKDGQIYLEVRSASGTDVEDNLWNSLVYSYSADKTRIQNMGSSVVYNKQMGETAENTVETDEQATKGINLGKVIK